MKVEFEELLNLQKEIDKSTKEMVAKLETARQKCNAISRLNSFKGKAADSAKRYFNATHGEIIESLVSAARQVEQRYNQIISEFAGTVDGSGNAVIHSDYLDDLGRKTRTLRNGMMDIHHEGAQILHGISDIVSIPTPDLDHFMESAEASRKFADEVNEKLHTFDRKALQIVKESRHDVDRAMKKLMEAGERSLTGSSSHSNTNAEFSKNHQGLEGKALLFIVLANAYKGFKRISDYLNKTDSVSNHMAQLYIYFKLMNKSERKMLKEGNPHAFHFTKEEYRKFNNYLNLTLFKFNDKKFMNHLKKYKFKAFTKENIQELVSSLEVFGKERGKLAMIKEFDKLYGFPKYREFKELSLKAKAVKAATIFEEELVGKKIKAVKKTIKRIPEWKNPKVAYTNIVNEFKDSTKELNRIGKAVKAGNKLLGPLSVGLTAKENYEKSHGDTQKFIVGTAVDTAYNSTATAIGTVIGTALCPPIGGVAGAAVGIGITALVNLKRKGSHKSLSERTKDFTNKGVDKIQHIGKNIAKWFK
ncbi:T7SS effector LXG polymorphic toxin [Weizmannia sp. CD-2023]|uniref:T7SS effector LXG polymorphic toxin n=2 Tax=Heyndrickxia TaxID=2837504 RepID=UPI000AE0B45E|nr:MULTISPECIES: T7SS effector LXG polymorphic toxin [Heyndrickxia]MED4320741.1 T7SS effector LXG polymorphic toxin [Weizmannia sp. CD-2023]MED4839511.1 T7SS effector LXG polymorphic toxin [Weizmannia sp. CD-2023]MED4866155.1 T7SS effector LXG polymorphic toxin [Weizmannia sp. CD-2023]